MLESVCCQSSTRRNEMAQDRPWRPADYWQPVMYVPPPQTRMNWGFEALDTRGSGERARARSTSALSQRRSQQRFSRALTITTGHVVAWMLACGLVAGIVATLMAVFVLHLF
jgi:hypothetical protein